MKRVTLIAAAFVFAVLAALTLKVSAQDFNTQERTFLTFSNAVELPGVTLPAGTYVFKLADNASRNVIQVFSHDEKDILGQWLFVQTERPAVSGDPVVMFKETPEGTTPAIQYWYYPGERIGKEFVYPKDQAVKIAARTGSNVKSIEGDISSNSTVSSVDAQGNVTQWQRESKAPEAVNTDNASTLRDAPAASQPSAAAGSLTGNRGSTPEPESSFTRSQAVGTAGNVSPEPQNERAAIGTAGSAVAQQTDSARSTRQPPTSTAATQTARAELPRTASPLALSGLIGLLSLAGAFGARRAAARG